MGVTFTKTIQIKSKWFAILFFSIFIIVGVSVIVFFSTRKNNTNSKYYYVKGVVESCELEAGPGGMNYIHSIAYSLKDHEYVWEYVDNVPKFYKGEKVNLKVNKEELGDVQLDLKTSTEKKARKQDLRRCSNDHWNCVCCCGRFGSHIHHQKKKHATN